MMKTYLKNLALLLFLIIISTQLLAQDTLYYNEDWEPCKKKEAAFLRSIQPDLQQFSVIDYYYPSMKIQMTGTYSLIKDKKEIENGFFQYFAEEGYKKSSGVFIEGKKEGNWKYFYSDGTLRKSYQYKNDQAEGTCYTYFINGRISRKDEYRKDTVFSEQCFTVTGKDTSCILIEEIMIYTEQMPEFPGGNDALYKFISDNINYPSSMKVSRMKCRVIPTFTIRKDGSIGDIKIANDVPQAFADETIRVFNRMPKWIPGMQNGKPVAVKFTLPITFSYPIRLK